MEISDSDSKDPDEMMMKIERELNNVKHEAFGKVKIRNEERNRDWKI